MARSRVVAVVVSVRPRVPAMGVPLAAARIAIAVEDMMADLLASSAVVRPARAHVVGVVVELAVGAADGLASGLRGASPAGARGANRRVRGPAELSALKDHSAVGLRPARRILAGGDGLVGHDHAFEPFADGFTVGVAGHAMHGIAIVAAIRGCAATRAAALAPGFGLIGQEEGQEDEYRENWIQFFCSHESL